MTTRWSLAQICVWIATKNASLGSALYPRSTIFDAGFVVFDAALASIRSEALDAGTRDVDIDAETEQGAARRKDLESRCLALVWEAREKLLEALPDEQNKLVAIGRANGRGDTGPIKPELWVGLTLHDEPGKGPGHGVVARPEDGLNSSATWFDEISLAVDDVLRVWPADGSAAAPSAPSRTRRGYDDDAIVAEIDAAIRRGEFKSPYTAALARKSDIQGGGTENSKVRRVAEKVRKLRHRTK
jgi:hypothetical protein